MRVLLDECIPRQFKACLTPEHDCQTVPEAGLAGKSNGELLALAEGYFDVFVTLDKGIRYQQNMTGRAISILLLRSKSNRLADVSLLAADCLSALQSIRAGEVLSIGAEG